MKKMKKILSLLCVLALFLGCFTQASGKEASLEAATAEGEAFFPEGLPGVFKLSTADKRVFTQNGVSYETYLTLLTVDFNGDGRCTAFEARAVLRIAASIDSFAGSVPALDVNQDGNITSGDARLILRYSANLDKYYTCLDGTRLSGVVTDEGGKSFYFSDGVLKSGLTEIDGTLYYFSASEGMATGLKVIDGVTYYFDGNGKAYSGKMTVAGKSYLFQNGIAYTGIRKEGGSVYCYGADGAMLTAGTALFEGIMYRFGTDGKGTPLKDPSTYKIAMIGDSLVANIGMSGVTDRIDFYGKVSLHASTIFDKKVSGSSRYVIDEISGRGYDVVIILVGINDLTSSDGPWGETYRKVIQGVKSRAPEAVVYAHAILPVNEPVSRKNGYTCTNAQIQRKNAVMKRIAAEENVKFLDAATVIGDSTGALPADGAPDGIHLYASTNRKWANWLLESVCVY